MGGQLLQVRTGQNKTEDYWEKLALSVEQVWLSLLQAQNFVCLFDGYNPLAMEGLS